jgi:hypothetical protein
MFPIQESNPTRSMPVVARALIPVNVLVFFFELTLPRQGVEDYLRHPIASVPGFLISSEISLTTVSSRVVEQIR